MSDPYPTHYLAWGYLPPFQRQRPCPRCGGDVRPRNANELCDVCRVDPVVLADRRERKKVLG